MEQNKNNEPEKKKETPEEKTDRWIEKANDYIDEAAEKIHESKAYKKTGQSAEKATKKLFRGAGKLWGKIEARSRKSEESTKREGGSGKSEEKKC